MNVVVFCISNSIISLYVCVLVVSSSVAMEVLDLL